MINVQIVLYISYIEFYLRTLFFNTKSERFKIGCKDVHFLVWPFFRNRKNNTARQVFHRQILYAYLNQLLPIDHLIVEQDFPWVGYWGQIPFPLGGKARFGKCLPSQLRVELE